MANEINEPPKPMTADITSRAFRFMSTPFAIKRPSMPRIWKVMLIKKTMARLVAMNRKRRVISYVIY